jgi:hypothetical protein
MEFLHLSAPLNQRSSPLPAADCTIGALERNSFVQRTVNDVIQRRHYSNKTSLCVSCLYCV